MKQNIFRLKSFLALMFLQLALLPLLDHKEAIDTLHCKCLQTKDR